MRFLSKLIVCLFLTGCASQGVSPREHNALVDWVACQKRAAATLDDGVSDPFSVAIAVDSACASPKQAAFEAMTADMTYSGEMYARPRFDAMTIKTATEIVLLHRRAMRVAGRSAE